MLFCLHQFPLKFRMLKRVYLSANIWQLVFDLQISLPKSTSKEGRSDCNESLIGKQKKQEKASAKMSLRKYGGSCSRSSILGWYSMSVLMRAELPKGLGLRNDLCK